MTLLTIIAAWLATNLLHAAWVGIRRHLWEKGLARDADGLLPDAAAFTVGDGPVALLFIHGFADTPCIWRRMAARLAATGAFTCRAMRLPGSAAPASQARKESLEIWRQSVDDELARLHAAHPRVWIIGHSLGAALAADAALRAPGSVSGLALLAPMIAVSRRRSPLLPPATWFQLARVALGLSPTFEACFSAEGVAVDDPAFTYTRDRFIPFCFYRALFQLIRANRRGAPRLTQPVFAATAEYDSVVDTPAALRWLADCPGPKEIRPLTEIGHVIPLEIGWQALTDDLAAFILRHPSLKPSPLTPETAADACAVSMNASAATEKTESTGVMTGTALFLALAAGILTAADAAAADTGGGDVQNTGYFTVVMDFDCLKVAKERLARGDARLTPALSALRAEADGWLTRGPFTVIAKPLVPPSGDKHDYMSFGPYWWPDPAKKDGLPFIRRDGEVNPQSVGEGSDRVALESMAAGTETLALAWFFTGERSYAQRAGALLAAWFLDPATCMRPHLKYGQAIPGRCEGRGIGIIETRRFLQVVNAVALLEGSEALTATQRQLLQDWFKTYLHWLRDSAYGQAESREANNHGTWYDAQVACFALYTGQRELAVNILTEARTVRLKAQVSADGQQKHELARTRAFTYSLVNLSGLLALAEMGRQAGVNYWDFPSAKESLLRAALDYVAAYADPQKAWPHQQITDLNRLHLYPFMQESRRFTSDPRYPELSAKFPPAEAQRQRANLLWPE